MAAILVESSENVKEERFNVVVERFVVEKHFCEETQILTIYARHVTVHLEYGYSLLCITVKLYARGVTVQAFGLKQTHIIERQTGSHTSQPTCNVTN